MRPLRRLAASRVPGVGSGSVQAPPRAPRQRRTDGVGSTDRRTGRHAPAVWIPADPGPVGSRWLVGPQGDGASPLAAVGAETGQTAGQSQASPIGRPGRERLPPPAVARQGRRALSSLTPLPRPVPSSLTTASSAGTRANSSAHVTPSRALTIRPVIQQRLSGSTTIRAGFGPRNHISNGLFDLGPGRLVEDLKQTAGVLSGLEGGASRGRHARDGLRRRHELQEPTGDAQADPSERTSVR